MSRQPELTNHIRKLRFEAREMTQETLAEKAGVTRQTIIALEANRYVPSLVLAIRIARAFDRSVEQVFNLSGT
jgi:putative transcriptional regulator